MVDFNKMRMVRSGTPIEDYREEFGLWVKREDLSCRLPGPPFSKTRGVFEHVKATPAPVIGVLDTFHSQAGHAVARACQILGKRCINFYPEFKGTPGPRTPQLRAADLGAELVGIPAGRSAVLYHTAKRLLREGYGSDSYMMPNALKLKESVEETAKEVLLLPPEVPWPDWVIIPSSSATIAAGVIRGFADLAYERGRPDWPTFIVHLGYSRSGDAVRSYLADSSEVNRFALEEHCVIVDEGYAYKDQARPGVTPPWPCNPYYDLKALRWWVSNRHNYQGSTLFWNVG